MHMYDMVKIDNIVFENAGGGGAFKAPPPRIVSCPDLIGLKEFIDYYKERNTTVFVTFLDDSKAFDKLIYSCYFRNYWTWGFLLLS